jgi:hypothetical protein
VAVRTADVRRGPDDLVALSHKVRSASGPELVELDGATCWVPEGWQGASDEHGTLVLECA